MQRQFCAQNRMVDWDISCGSLHFVENVLLAPEIVVDRVRALSCIWFMDANYNFNSFDMLGWERDAAPELSPKDLQISGGCNFLFGRWRWWRNFLESSWKYQLLFTNFRSGSSPLLWMNFNETSLPLVLQIPSHSFRRRSGQVKWRWTTTSVQLLVLHKMSNPNAIHQPSWFWIWTLKLGTFDFKFNTENYCNSLAPQIYILQRSRKSRKII